MHAQQMRINSDRRGKVGARQIGGYGMYAGHQEGVQHYVEIRSRVFGLHDDVNDVVYEREELGTVQSEREDLEEIVRGSQLHRAL